MAWWKQILIVLALVLATAAVWAYHMPGATPLLARLGLPAAEGAAPAPRGDRGGRAPAAGGATRVTGAIVTEAEANGHVSAIGDGKALRSVSVLPMAPGRLIAIEVASGDRVAAGATIARLDSDAEVIALDRARLAVEDAEETLARTERLRTGGAATEVQLRESRLALENARLEVRDAELALSRRDVTAPIGGVVGLLPVDPGSQVGTTTEIATIDDRTRILVDFRVPERFAGRLAIGDPVDATALARPELALRGEIVALDSRVDPASRTLKVQAALDNGADLLRGGMAFSIGLHFDGDRYPAIDPLALQWGGDGPYVWVARDGRAARVPVRVVQRDSDRLLVSGELSRGERVVTEGTQRLREGAALTFEEDND